MNQQVTGTEKESYYSKRQLLNLLTEATLRLCLLFDFDEKTNVSCYISALTEHKLIRILYFLRTR